MVIIFRYIAKKAFQSIRFVVDSIILFLPIYYKKLNKISLKRWYEILNNNIKSLYKVDFINYLPQKFADIITDMVFQADYVNPELLELKADIAVLRAQMVITKTPALEYQIGVLENQIKEKQAESDKAKMMTLNEFVFYIERTFDKIGSIDPDKIDASKGMSLYYKAIEENKRLQQLYTKN